MLEGNVQETLENDNDSKILNERKDNFIERIKVKPLEKPITDFPSDESILEKIDKSERMYVFGMEDIDKKIKMSKLTKAGEQLFLYRKKINTSRICGFCTIHSQYYIINASGQTVGRIPVTIGSPNSLSLDYEIKRDFQGKGFGTIALEEVVKQIYKEKEFDQLSFESVKYPNTNKTSIKCIDLEISDDNEASKRIATKNGFKKAGNRYFALTLEDYVKQQYDIDR